MSGFSSDKPLSVPKLEVVGSHTLYVTDFIEVAKSFIEENYKGLVNITARIISYERVTLSEYYLIKLFKKLVSVSKFGRLVNVNFSCDYSTFSIEMACNDGERFDRSSECELIRLARDAGFEARRSEHGLIIFKEVFEPAVISVFTSPVTANTLATMFRDIFSEE